MKARMMMDIDVSCDAGVFAFDLPPDAGLGDLTLRAGTIGELIDAVRAVAPLMVRALVPAGVSVAARAPASPAARVSVAQAAQQADAIHAYGAPIHTYGADSGLPPALPPEQCHFPNNDAWQLLDTINTMGEVVRAKELMQLLSWDSSRTSIAAMYLHGVGYIHGSGHSGYCSTDPLSERNFPRASGTRLSRILLSHRDAYEALLSLRRPAYLSEIASVMGISASAVQYRLSFLASIGLVARQGRMCVPLADCP